MSFILDALKKSETDRQRQGATEFTGVPTRPQSPTVPRWLWLVAALLAVNLIVLIGLLLRPEPVPPQRVATEPAATTEQPRSSFSDQAATARRNIPAQQVERPAAAMIDTPPPAETADEFVKPVLISQDPSAVPASSIYPTYQEVLARGHINLPPLHLDIHVYSPQPGDRFAFINMSKLREGSTLAEGPRVAEITPDGVVLRYEGQVFLLPRE